MEARAEVLAIEDGATAAALLDPLRLRIVASAQEPISATGIAEVLGLPRQRVNYHVRALAKAGVLKRAGTRKRRNMIEQRYVATARSYVVAPTVLGPVAADPRRITDPLSAAHLLALAARMQADLGASLRQAAAADQRISTLSINADFEFASPAQRTAFAKALRDAITRVIAEHTDNPGSGGHPYRLALGCYPPPKDEET